jgi:tetratricopeptide (TPR) repeat protein
MPIRNRLTALTSKCLLDLDWFARHLMARGLLVLGLRSRAMAVFHDILERSPDDVHALNSLGYDAQQSGRPLEALTLFRRVAGLVPMASNAHFNEAFVSEMLGLLNEAEASFRAAIAIEPVMDRAWYGLGLVLLRQGRLDEALEAFIQNTRLQPMSPFGWYQLARVHVDLGQLEAARIVIRQLKGFEPKAAAQLERETGMTV